MISVKKHNTQEWIHNRKQGVIFLYIEAIYVLSMALFLALDFPIFVIEFKAGVCLTIFLMIKELIEILLNSKGMQSWRKTLNIQMLFNLMLVLWILFFGKKHLTLDLIVLGVLLYLFVSNLFRKNFVFNQLNKVFRIIALPILFSFCLNECLVNLSQQFPIIKIPAIILYILLYLIYLIPEIVLDYGDIKNPWLRIVSVIWLTLVLLSNLEMYISMPNDFLQDLFNTNILPGFALLILSPFLVKRWGYKYCLNLHIKKIPNLRLLTLLILLLFTIWLTFFNTYVYVAQVPEEMFFNWDLSIVVIHEWAVLRSLGAAFLEETQRYLIIILLLSAFPKIRGKLEATIFLSALQFGFLHLYNLVNTDTKLTEVLLQVGYTFAYGCFLAVLYLYTGQIWLTMLSHFSLDLLSYSVSSGPGFLSLYGNPDLLSGLIFASVALLGTILMLFGKRKKVMQINISRLVAQF